MGDDVDVVAGVLDNQLTPRIDEILVRPPRVQGLDIEIVFGAAELQHVEQEKRRIGIGEGGMVGKRARSADARIEFSEVDGAVILIDEKIDIEITAIAFFDELVAELERHVTCLAPDRFGEGAREHFVAAPAAFVRSELLATDHFG